jgi:hypothetical protein
MRRRGDDVTGRLGEVELKKNKIVIFFDTKQSFTNYVASMLAQNSSI